MVIATSSESMPNSKRSPSRRSPRHSPRRSPRQSPRKSPSKRKVPAEFLQRAKATSITAKEMSARGKTYSVAKSGRLPVQDRIMKATITALKKDGAAGAKTAAAKVK